MNNINIFVKWYKDYHSIIYTAVMIGSKIKLPRVNPRIISSICYPNNISCNINNSCLLQNISKYHTNSEKIKQEISKKITHQELVNDDERKIKYEAFLFK